MLYSRKGVFYLKNLCETLGLRRLSVREMCTLALLIAITVLLSVYATFRVGNAIKIPMKFISVFVTAALFGPLPAALTALLGDVLNAFLVPVGPPLPQISLIEFVSGFIYGMFFYRRWSFSKTYIACVILCVALQGILDIFGTSYVLYSVGYFPSYMISVSVRLPASAIKMVLQCVVIFAGTKYLPVFGKIVYKKRGSQ